MGEQATNLDTLRPPLARFSYTDQSGKSGQFSLREAEPRQGNLFQPPHVEFVAIGIYDSEDRSYTVMRGARSVTSDGQIRLNVQVVPKTTLPKDEHYVGGVATEATIQMVEQRVFNISRLDFSAREGEPGAMIAQQIKQTERVNVSYEDVLNANGAIIDRRCVLTPKPRMTES